MKVAQDQNLEGQQRAAAGDLLDPFGDSTRFAFDPARWYLPAKRHLLGKTKEGLALEPIPGFVYVPAGQFTRGQTGEPDNAPENITLDRPFYIARTLTTVDQWAAFIAAGGYEAKHQSLWGAQGWAWRQGEYDSQVNDEDYKTWLSSRTKEQRGEPRFWADQIAFGNRAVAGVNWFEARAYCRWLTSQLEVEINEAGLGDHQVRLPLEDQWERAARAENPSLVDARRWPWSNDGADAKQAANVDVTGLGAASAVATFAPNPLGLFDLAGNVWEWQDNLYRAARKGPEIRVADNANLVAKEEIDKADTLALRGGSWSDAKSFARCAYRRRYLPDYAIDDVGLRVVLSLVGAKS